MFEIVFDYASSPEDDMSVGASYGESRTEIHLDIDVEKEGLPHLQIKLNRDQFDMLQATIKDMELPKDVG